ncbi:MAG: SoxR reducing system RseC family protein [Pseudomonadota bacterium]
MLTETGRIVALDDDAVWVETVRKTTCGSCAAQKGCGHGLINKLGEGRRGYVKVLTGDVAIANCRIDDEAEISIPEDVIVRGSLVAYLLPLLSMLAAAIAGAQWFPESADGAAAIGAVLGLGVGFVLVRLHAMKHRHDPRYQPVLMRVRTPLSPSAAPLI